VEGVVSFGGKGLAGATLNLRHDDATIRMSARTDEAGTFRFDDVPFGAVELTLSMQQNTIPNLHTYRITRKSIVEDGQITQEDFVIDGYDGAVEGYVRDGQAVANFADGIYVGTDRLNERRSYEVSIDEHGYFFAPYLPPGGASTAVRGRLPGSQSSTRARATVEVVHGSVVRHDFDLSTLAIVSGTVTGLGANVKAVIHVLPGRLQASQIDWNDMEAYRQGLPSAIFLDEDAPYAISFEKPGDYTLAIVTYRDFSDSIGAQDAVPITLSEGENTAVNFQF
jgi:hypothetical protein